jgi:histidyl-tRNA synthetase
MFNKSPTKGMRDFLPKDYLVRKRILAAIEETYAQFGFTRIETPAVESLALLSSKQGGDNEKLIYKILKRGEKLENADGELCDLGLRYDLTIPLARYYANNSGSLPSVFKAMQLDNVWRADRPQRGRFRQFMQCDIDIIGESSNIAEIDLITATTEALAKLNLSGVTVRLNDRRILSNLLTHCGFAPENHNSILITLDKMDKIGVTGVLEEVQALEGDKAERFIDIIGQISTASNPLLAARDVLGSDLDKAAYDNLSEILLATKSTVTAGKVVFDVTLVRGMDYYTSTIYEIALEGLGLSCGGGGRYDRLIGKITGTDVPACGFSIGFERIVMLYIENSSAVSIDAGIAIIVPKDITPAELVSVYESARHFRKTQNVNVLKRIKNFSYQLDQLRVSNYSAVYEYVSGKLSPIKL